MDLKLPALSHLRSRRRRDPGVSLHRTERHWMLSLVAATIVASVTVGIALFEFYMAEQEDVILTDPVATARYRAEDVKKALERYDARRESYVIGEPVPVPEKKIETPADTEGDVAAPPALRVE